MCRYAAVSTRNPRAVCLLLMAACREASVKRTAAPHQRQRQRRMFACDHHGFKRGGFCRRMECFRSQTTAAENSLLFKSSHFFHERESQMWTVLRMPPENIPSSVSELLIYLFFTSLCSPLLLRLQSD